MTDKCYHLNFWGGGKGPAKFIKIDILPTKNRNTVAPFPDANNWSDMYQNFISTPDWLMCWGFFALIKKSNKNNNNNTNDSECIRINTEKKTQMNGGNTIAI